MDKRIQELQQRVVSLEKQQQSYWDSMTVIDERQKNQEKRLTALEKHAELKDKQCNGLQDKVAKLEEAVQMVKKCTCDKEPCICFSKPTCKTCKDTKLVPAWADYMKSVPCPACAKKCICNTTPCSCVPNLKCGAPKTSCACTKDQFCGICDKQVKYKSADPQSERTQNFEEIMNDVVAHSHDGIKGLYVYVSDVSKILTESKLFNG